WCDLERMRRRWQRLNEQKEIDRHIQAWVEDVTFDPVHPDAEDPDADPEIPVVRMTTEQLMNHFQRFGVPCGIVNSPEAMRSDPQIVHRGHYWMLEHPVMGLRTYDGPAFRLSDTPSELTKAAPLLGENNEYVYKDLVGLSDEEFVELLADGAFE
ncbi:MAG TPA: CoA transferase, partial [Tepidiformaceae bacterium]|nr:CoA transferase [Tepidiformaceae bacterium]